MGIVKQKKWTDCPDESILRFEEKIIEDDETGCWLWTGSLDVPGYGAVNFQGKTMGAHRFSCSMYLGTEIAGLSVDHLCRNPSCVNPCHLEAVTHLENCRRKSVSYYNLHVVGKSMIP